MTSEELRALLGDLADGWRRRDHARVASRFAPDVEYADPLRYRFTDRASLQAFFEDDGELAQQVEWHSITFDEPRQCGAVEYTYDGTHRYHGVALFQIREGLIARWREYQHVDARPFEELVAGPPSRGQADSAPTSSEEAIRAMVDRETRAWNERDPEALASLFHPDMVWPWPAHPRAHDPAEWVMVLGRFDRARWVASWQSLFDATELVANVRHVAKIILSKEGDGALAVVDIDTTWREKDGTLDRWKGRVGKVYCRLPDGEWKITMHTGVLDYAGLHPPPA